MDRDRPSVPALLLSAVLLAGACSSPSVDPEEGAEGVGPSGAAASDAGDGDLDGSESGGSPDGDGSTTDDAEPAPGAEDQAEDDQGATDRPAAPEPAVWTVCDDGFECASVPVPLDHDDPTGRQIDIALIRRPATEIAVGSILVNPGGPGASGVRLLQNGFALDDRTMSRYHLVGFDPRGVGLSAGLRCGVDLTIGPRPDFSPDSADERNRLDDDARELAARCSRTDADLLPHVGTESVVNDLELLRQAVGDDRLHYMGLSYGTLIGLRYAERWPETIGRMVLDGLVNPGFTLSDLLRQQAVEFERAFEVIDDACGTDLSCPTDGIAVSYDALMRSLEQGGARGEVGPAELQTATIVTMYSERLWQRYATALEAAEDGNFSELERLHDAYVGGTSFAAYAAVSCIDSRSPSGADRWEAFAAELAAIAPRFGAAIANELRTCAFWPVTADTEPRPVTAPGSVPILVLSTTGDAATPVANAVEVAATLSASSLVLVDDAGHTAYGRSFCVEQIVADYFEHGEVPGPLHRC